MKVYVTKWWKTRGIVEAKLVGDEVARDAKWVTVEIDGRRLPVGKPDWDLSRAWCVKRVRKLRDLKRAALYREIERLNNMAIE